MDLMFQPLKRYFDFQGRSRRSEYWLWVLFKIILGALLLALSSLFVGGSGISHIAGIGIVVLLRVLVFFILLIPDIAVSVRRMHDIDRTGWWILFPALITLIVSVIYFAVRGSEFLAEMQALRDLSQMSDPQILVSALLALMVPLMWVVIPTLLAKIVTLVFRCTDGTPGPNRFGRDPKGRGEAGVF
ncbi:DUF805 domain-containing protein [Asticcacaulis sp. EMRT-3]|uniref:DUF805 domain-containing protein n=1 Tax=Asticcacaulis sp. EMRT-3 TaxID=3040349 RepID=UPI0024AEF995|nr:DUF805 domain-containing protein [Asticcacaulis sp. EMRT-3]MDI7774896.1 DUF805 domain-containing protein [Asticcacaulis sp. EMRT-3]